jgi:hypothetical protein
VPHGKIECAWNRSREEDQAGEAEQGFRHRWGLSLAGRSGTCHGARR